MTGQLFEFDPPARFVAGTVGEPGERTFYLQATGGGRTISVSLEKIQVQALAEKLEELLDEVRRRQGPGSPVPAIAPPDLEDVAPLEVPIDEEFRVGTLALAWDDDGDAVLIEAQSMEPEPLDPESLDPETLDPDPLNPAAGGGAGTEFTGDLLRVRITPAAARAFALRARRVVAAGRPPCPLCGNPLDPAGHICPRHNGHRG
jgi:uncharacterized repeat protein (TIGR03847 family)